VILDRYQLIDLILFDHQTMKDCLQKLKNEECSSREKFICAKEFLNTLQGHLEAEEQIVYKKILHSPQLHRKTLRAFEEHDVIHSRLRDLIPKFLRLRNLSEDLEARIGVLAEIVDRHFKEEETRILPYLSQALTREENESLVLEYMKVRHLTEAQLSHQMKHPFDGGLLKHKVWSEIDNEKSPKDKKI